ncbi:hypothetical protein LZK98_08100 [Sphingomonas cannabina]|uniref:hypothetical protein n=1 Tax=Sphingomonas cannabina TaxID=2899123 RepID=UPI001F26501F|nr:hypothetical protein [Sphingomonas cannabina]UIJ46890.1 hypothetical protein LZK98_08100 [Sphingomonas cannabina]
MIAWNALAALALRNWKLVLSAIVFAALAWMLVDARSSAAEWERVASDRQATIDQARRAITVANGWPEGKVIRADQIAMQIGYYGNLIRDIRAKRAEAKAEDIAHARAVETAQAAITQETEDALRAQLAAARAAAAAFAERLRSAEGSTADVRGNRSAAGLPVTTGPSQRTAGAGGAPVVDASDLRICSENTVKAQGWQDWYQRVFADGSGSAER